MLNPTTEGTRINKSIDMYKMTSAMQNSHKTVSTNILNSPESINLLDYLSTSQRLCYDVQKSDIKEFHWSVFYKHVRNAYY